MSDNGPSLPICDVCSMVANGGKAEVLVTFRGDVNDPSRRLAGVRGSSGLLPIADVEADIDLRRSGPGTDIAKRAVYAAAYRPIIYLYVGIGPNALSYSLRPSS